VKYLTIYTQNIWFSPHERGERFEEIVRFIEEFRPDFVCLQEFIKEFSDRLLKSELIVREYFISQNTGNWYTVQILSKWPCSLTKIPYHPHTVMARSLLLASTVINGVPITISTSHLESSDGYKGYSLRCKQMEIAFSALEGHANAMIMGDFNYDASKSKEEASRDESFVDLFDSGPDSTLKFTYIPREERLDRMLLRGTDWEPIGQYFLVGTEPIPKFKGMSIFQGGRVRSLSDHLGIISIIKFKD
jgi:endonuclease/exonuclease/phosphatase family metal-dependent hydrolase